VNKKEELKRKLARQQEIINSAKAAGRDMSAEEQTEFDGLQRDIDTLKVAIADEEREITAQSDTDRAVKAERQRVSDITALCREFEIDPKDHIDSGAGIDTVRAAVIEKLTRDKGPVVVSVVREEADKFRAAASDGILLRAGKVIEKPAPGATDLRGMRLRDLAVDCVLRKGRANAHWLDDDALFREALTPDSQFSGILDNTVNKSMAQAYRAAATTYQAWTSRGSLVDFKATKIYQISEAGELEEMTQSGEFKFDGVQDQGVSRILATFGRSWGFTRQALINDDLGMLVRVPEAYVRASARGINKLVYKQLNDNVTIYDTKALFHTDHGNLAGTGDYIGTSTVSAGRTAMRKQTNLRGLETLNIAPSFLLVPAALETDSQQFLWSIADPAGDHSGVANVFRNALSLVVDAEIDTTHEYAWYLAAAPGDIDTIEVAFLNGNDMPKLESQVGFDFLGIKWRIFIDYGVTVIDYRGLYCNPGKAAS
jgi:hypothetical protein